MSDTPNNPLQADSPSIDPRLDAIIHWIRQTTDVAGGRGALIPVSGGSDSALCFWLCARALPPGRAIAAYVGRDLRCRAWFESQGPLHCLPDPPPNDSIEPESLRWAMMVSHARAVRGWIAGSRNRTEETLGTYSLASRVVTYLPLAGLWKSEVMELCTKVGVPADITRASQRADPACGRPQQMADIPFAEVDCFLQVRARQRPKSDLAQLDPQKVHYLASILRRNRFKRKLPLRAPPYPQAHGPA